MKNYLFSFLFILCGYAGAAQNKIPSFKITELEKYIAQVNNGVVVVNFWATFCKPCIAEIPSFIKVTDSLASQNVALVLVSLDLPSFYPKQLTAFVKKNNYSAPVIWLNETDADYFCTRVAKSWSGAIPATLIVNNKTGYRKFFEDEMSAENLRMEIEQALQP